MLLDPERESIGQQGPSGKGILSGIPLFFGDSVMADQQVKCRRVVRVELEPKRDADDLIAKAFRILKSRNEPHEPPALIKQDELLLSNQEVEI